MSLNAQIIDQRVNGLMGEKSEEFEAELNIKNDEQKLKSASFTYLVAKSILGLADEGVMDGLVDGGNDFGIDAIYYDAPVDGEFSVTIIQGKYKKNLSGDANFPENGIIKMIDAIGALFDPSRDVTINDRLKERIEEVRSFVAGGAIPRVYAVAANNGASWNGISEERIKEARKYFGDQVSWRHIGANEVINLLQAKQPISASLQLDGAAMVESFDYRRVLIGKMSVLELAKLIEAHGDRLLERNIRRYLGLSGNRVNEAVADTLRDPNQRPNFYFYNNGVTLICSQFRYNALQQKDWQLKLDGLQIVNGGQTSKTVQQIVEEIGPEVANAQVLVRIYELQSDDEALVSSITYATNSQNPVDLRDLKANDEKQKQLEQSIAALGFQYRAKREDRTTTSDEFTSSVIAEAVLAVWRHRPHQARFSSGKHFGALYDVIFTKDLNGAQAIIAALISRQVENRRKRPPEGAPDFLPYGAKFISMMIGKYLLEELNITVGELNHNNFALVKKTLDERLDAYFTRAEEEIEEVISPLFGENDRSLQKLSATFRRADILSDLLHTQLNALQTDTT
jgi:hypothetical protein